MQSPTSTPTSWSDPSSTLAPEALLLGGWHTHWRPTTTLQLPPAMFCSHAHAHLHLWPDCAAFGPAHPCHSSTQGSLAHHQPQRPPFHHGQLIKWTLIA